MSVEGAGCDAKLRSGKTCANVFARSSEGLETGVDPDITAGSVHWIDCSILVNSPGPAVDGWAATVGADAGAGAAAGAVAGSAALKDCIIRVNSPGAAGACPVGSGLAGIGSAAAGWAAAGAWAEGDDVITGLFELPAGAPGCFKREASRSSSEEAGAVGTVLKIPVALEGSSSADWFPLGESGSSNGGRGALMDDHPA
jgi:hypothetical protein